MPKKRLEKLKMPQRRSPLRKQSDYETAALHHISYLDLYQILKDKFYKFHQFIKYLVPEYNSPEYNSKTADINELKKTIIDTLTSNWTKQLGLRSLIEDTHQEFFEYLILKERNERIEPTYIDKGIYLLLSFGLTTEQEMTYLMSNTYETMLNHDIPTKIMELYSKFPDSGILKLNEDYEQHIKNMVDILKKDPMDESSIDKIMEYILPSLRTDFEIITENFQEWIIKTFMNNMKTRLPRSSIFLGGGNKRKKENAFDTLAVEKHPEKKRVTLPSAEDEMADARDKDEEDLISIIEECLEETNNAAFYIYKDTIILLFFSCFLNFFANSEDIPYILGYKNLSKLELFLRNIITQSLLYCDGHPPSPVLNILTSGGGNNKKIRSIKKKGKKKSTTMKGKITPFKKNSSIRLRKGKLKSIKKSKKN